MMTTATAIATLSTISAVSLIALAGKWKLFKKMGLEGWKSLIPIYSEYLVFKKTWNGKMFLASVVTSVAGGCLLNLSAYGSHFNPFLASVGMAIAAGAFVIDTTLLYKLAKSFGHGIGYTLGLIFAQPLFTTILGFDKSEYVAAYQK